MHIETVWNIILEKGTNFTVEHKYLEGEITFKRLWYLEEHLYIYLETDKLYSYLKCLLFNWCWLFLYICPEFCLFFYYNFGFDLVELVSERENIYIHDLLFFLYFSCVFSVLFSFCLFSLFCIFGVDFNKNIIIFTQFSISLANPANICVRTQKWCITSLQ